MVYFENIQARYQSFKCRFCGTSTMYNNYWQGRDEETLERYPIPFYQCQTCGEVQAAQNREYEHIWDYSNDRCKCGGELRRDRPLFCPSCKGQKKENGGQSVETIGN